MSATVTPAPATKRTPLPTPPASFLIHGETGSGKTPQIGLFAKWLHQKTGGRIEKGQGGELTAVGGLRTRLYCTDEGGWRSIQPYVNLGIVLPVNCLALPHPWLWYDCICKGMVPDFVTGKWIQDPRADEIGCNAIDGLTGVSDAFLQDMAAAAARGVNIGGEGAFSFDVTDESGKKIQGTDGKDMKIGSNNRAHYLQIQQRLVKNIGVFNRLLAKDRYVISTATDRRGQDEALSTVLGVQLAGKALAAEAPRLFTYTFHLVNIANDSSEAEHRLYVTTHMDRSAGNAKVIANRRLPVVNPAKDKEKFAKLPAFVSPADIIVAYKQILDAEKDAEGQIAAEYIQPNK